MLKNLSQSAVVVGGILPMILLGITNFIQKPYSQKISPATWVIGLALGGIIAGCIIEYFFLGHKHFLVNIFSQPKISRVFCISILTGFLWGSAIALISFAFSKLNGEASKIWPIVNANVFITVILAILFLNEKIIIWKIFTGAALIFLGVLFLL